LLGPELRVPTTERFFRWFWCKRDPRIGDDGQMPGFVPVEELFKGRHFDQEIVVLCVRWYLSYKLS
jgi:hypothetical protein